ncbi:MAG: secretion system protein [Acidimicrobiales bacterium]|nr:secretion system protein [Acidimicrobiales bacterium]
MSALLAALFGAGIGLGIWFLIQALQPKPLALDAVDTALARPGQSVASARQARRQTEGPSAKDHIGAAVLRFAQATTFLDNATLERRLTILDKPIERHVYEKVLGAIAGFMLPLLMVGVLATQNVDFISLPLVAIASIALAVLGFFYPDVPLAEQVEERQRSFRQALSSYLDLVTIILAGGGGVESALEGAAEAGDGWVFAELRSALRRARLTRRSPWETLNELGERMDITELRELAASVGLAGGQGARVRQSLSARADALRAATAADFEYRAEVNTEKMVVPVIVLVFGIVLFIAYGAVNAISTGGSPAEVVDVDSP